MPTSVPALTARQRAILVVLLGAGFMLSADFSILNVALPQAGADTGLSAAQLPWITSAYALPAAGFSLLFGRLADLFGRRRMLLGGLLVLILGSLLGAVAHGPAGLLAARALQGFATAMTMPAAMSLLTTLFPAGPVRARILGLNGALLCGGFTTGALVGGALVDLLHWRAVFSINVPVAVVLACMTPAVIPEMRRTGRVRLDVPGAVTVTGGLLAVVYAVIERSLPAAIAGAVLLVAFGLIERRSTAPLVPVTVLALPSVRWGNLAGLVILSVENGVVFLMTLYLQRVLGVGPLGTGLVLGVPGLAAIVAGVVAGRLVGRFGGRTVLTVSMTLQALSIAPLMLLGTGPWVLALVVPALFVGFFCHVSGIVAFTVTGTSGLPASEQGLATGLTSLTDEIAGTLGVPVLGAIAATRAGLLDGVHLALGVGVATMLVGAVAVRYGLRPRTGHPVLMPLRPSNRAL